MSLRPQNRRFAPSLLAVVLTLAGVALFLRLGFWQLDRAEQKAALVEQYRQGERSTVSLNAADIERLPRYQHIEAAGRFDSSRQILLDNMPSQHGRPGYRVLTPFELQSGGRILVDRGWIPAPPTRDVLPDVAVAENLRTLRGRLDELPRPGMRLAGATPPESETWPRVWHFPQAEDLARALGEPLARRIVLLDDSAADGYERVWRAHFRVEPVRHIAYAVQWFAFALVALILFAVMSLKRPPSET